MTSVVFNDGHHAHSETQPSLPGEDIMHLYNATPIFIALAFTVGCANEVGLTTEPETRTITNTVTEVVTEYEEAPQETKVDPCDIAYRAYSEDGHYVDLTLGAVPQVTVYLEEAILPAHSSTLTTFFEVKSRDLCGTFTIWGVEAKIDRVDEAPFAFTKGTGPINELHNLKADVIESAPTSWSGNTQDFDTAYAIWSAWDAMWGPNDDLGAFDAITITEEVIEFSVALPVLAYLPPGEYKLTHTLHWQDEETGAIIAFDNIDDAITYITLVEE